MQANFVLYLLVFALSCTGAFGASPYLQSVASFYGIATEIAEPEDLGPLLSSLLVGKSRDQIVEFVIERAETRLIHPVIVEFAPTPTSPRPVVGIQFFFPMERYTRSISAYIRFEEGKAVEVGVIESVFEPGAGSVVILGDFPLSNQLGGGTVIHPRLPQTVID